MVPAAQARSWYRIEEVSARGAAAVQHGTVTPGAAHPTAVAQSLTPGEERHFSPSILLASLEL